MTQASDGPQAVLWPSEESDFGSASETVRVTIYVVSGRHGFITVPESFCRECHLFVKAADDAADRVETSVEVRVVSWWTRFPWALRHGGYHPPVMIVDGKRLAQGYDVPSTEDVIEAIRSAAD